MPTTAPLVNTEVADTTNLVIRWITGVSIALLVVIMVINKSRKKKDKLTNQNVNQLTKLDVMGLILGFIMILALIAHSSIGYFTEISSLSKSNTNVSKAVEDKYGITLSEDLYDDFSKLSERKAVLTEGALPGGDRVPLTVTLTDDNLDVEVQLIGASPELMKSVKE